MPAVSSAGSTRGWAGPSVPRCACAGPTASSVRGSHSRPTGSASSNGERTRSGRGRPRHDDPRRGRPMTPRLVEIQLPDFGPLEAAPEIAGSTYAARMERLRARAQERGLDRLVVYADREHSANLAYLTGFDPRFEEAVLVVGPAGTPAILVGNECYGLAGAAPLAMRRHLYQDLSLPSQPR